MYVGENNGDQPQPQLPQPESVWRRQPNPYHSFGDAFKEWKERVYVSVDLQTYDTDTQDEIKDDNADEFGYVSEF